jgi:hypothetical protein
MQLLRHDAGAQSYFMSHVQRARARACVCVREREREREMYSDKQTINLQCFCNLRIIEKTVSIVL